MFPLPSVRPKNIIQPVSLAFLPSDLANLALWLKADAGVFSDAGSTPAGDTDTVQQWNDQSGNGRNFSQTTPAKQPVFRTGIVNSLPVVRFDGTDDLMVHAANFSSATSGTIFIVYQLATTQNEQALLSTGDEASTVPYSSAPGFRNSVNPFITSNFHDGSQRDYLSGNTSLSTGAWYIGTWQSSGTAISLWVNGTAQTISVVLGTNDGDWWGDASGRDNFAVGARKNNTELNFFNGDIAEIVAYTDVKSGDDFNNIKNYLADKYNITVS